METISRYGRILDFDSVDVNPKIWSSDIEYNLMFIVCLERYFNQILKAYGYVKLADVYQQLGIPKTDESEKVGWIYDKNNKIGDNYISFGLYSEHNKYFINGFKNSVVLDFNVDGNIELEAFSKELENKMKINLKGLRINKK